MRIAVKSKSEFFITIYMLMVQLFEWTFQEDSVY